MAITRMERRAALIVVYERDGRRCYWCLRAVFIKDQRNKPDADTATFDHIVPDSWGGAYHSSNGVCACPACNVDRGTMRFDAYKRVMEARGRTAPWGVVPVPEPIPDPAEPHNVLLYPPTLIPVPT